MRRSENAIRTVRSWLERVTGTSNALSARAAARSWRRGGLGLIILCLLVYIPGLWTIPPVDRDESRFAQASRQMLESDTLEGWVVPRVQDKPRLNKPPLIYWLQAGSAAVLGDSPGQWAWLDGGSENIWVYRVPSLLSAMAAVLLTWRLGLRMFDPRAAWLAAALLAVCPMVVWDAHQARADQLLLATTTATMLALWSVFRPPSSPPGRGNVLAQRGRGEGARRPNSRAAWPIAFWLSLSLGIMTKGPITPMIAALTCVALSVAAREWKWMLRLRPVLGVIIVIAIVGPWVYLVGQEVGWSKYLSIVYDETIGRSAGAKEGHWGPPGYHIVLLGALFWPGSLLTAAAIGRAWRRGLRASTPLPLPAPPPLPAGEVAESARPEGARDVPAAPAASASPPPPPSLPEPRDTSPAGSGGGAKAPLFLRIWRALRDARPSRPAELFLLAWMLPSWIIFELISTKLPHYTMPLYPAVALMSARMLLHYASRRPFFRANQENRAELLRFLAKEHAPCPICKYDLHSIDRDRCPECGTQLAFVPEPRESRVWGKPKRTRVLVAGQNPSQRAGEGIWWTIGAMLTFGAPVALGLFASIALDPMGATLFKLNLSPLVISFTLFAAIGSLFFMFPTLRQLKDLRPLAATCRAMAAIVLGYFAIFSTLLPHSDYLWISRELRSQLEQLDPERRIPVADTGFFEDSFVFITRGRVQRIAEHDALTNFLRANNTSIVLTTDNKLDAVLDTMREHDIDLQLATKLHWVSGYNYSKGEPVTVRVNEVRHK